MMWKETVSNWLTAYAVPWWLCDLCTKLRYAYYGLAIGLAVGLPVSLWLTPPITIGLKLYDIRESKKYIIRA